MDRDEFKNLIEEIKRVHKFADELYQLHFNYGLEAPDTLTLEDEVIKLLRIVFNEPEETFWFFMYDMNFGDSYKTGDFIVNGENIDISTVDKFYDYLISNIN